MTNDTLITWMISALGVLVVTVVLVGGWWWQSYKCESRWSESGMKSHFSLVTGCMIQVAPGKIIPQDSYREIPN